MRHPILSLLSNGIYRGDLINAKTLSNGGIFVLLQMTYLNDSLNNIDDMNKVLYVWNVFNYANRYGKRG